MTTIASQLEAALPANDDDNGPVTLPASVVREAVASIISCEKSNKGWVDAYGVLSLQLTDQQNARWRTIGLAILTFTLGYITAVMVGGAG